MWLPSLLLYSRLGTKIGKHGFLELRRLDFELYYKDNAECDFGYAQGVPHTLIQVCCELNNDNMHREVEG